MTDTTAGSIAKEIETLKIHPAPRLADNELSEKEKAIVRMVNE
jgi:hypothetical protein